jgi:hypothetical protein
VLACRSSIPYSEHKAEKLAGADDILVGEVIAEGNASFSRFAYSDAAIIGGEFVVEDDVFQFESRSVPVHVYSA